MKKLTLNYLKRHDACPEKKSKFKELYGNECDVTIENALRWREAVSTTARWDFMWLIYKIIEGKRFSKHSDDLYKHVTRSLPRFGSLGVSFDYLCKIGNTFERYTYSRLMKALVQIVRAG